MGTSVVGDNKYLLVMMDDFSNYVRLFPTATPTAEHAADSLLDWMSLLGNPEIVISDTATHFKNVLMSELVETLRIEQMFSVAYTPWTNGTIENMNKQVVTCFRKTFKERKIPVDEWTSFVKYVQYTMNHYPRPKFEGKSPLQVLNVSRYIEYDARGKPTLRDVTDETMPVLQPDKLSLKKLNVDEQFYEDYLPTVIELLDNFHREILMAVEARRLSGNESKSVGRKRVNFEIGDYVLVARIKRGRDQKLLGTWTGPFQVIACKSGHIFVVKNLRTKQTRTVHAARMARYHDQHLRITQELLYSTVEDDFFKYDDFVDIKMDNRNTVEVKLSWTGFEEMEWSWEELKPIMSHLNDRGELIRSLNRLTLDKPAIRRVLRDKYKVKGIDDPLS